MGLDGVSDFLKKKHPSVFCDMHISHFAHKKICFDVSSYIYKYICAYGKERNKWLQGFSVLIQMFRRHGLNMVPVLDGKPADLKLLEQVNRGAQRVKGDETVFNLRLDLSRYKNSGDKSDSLINCMKRLHIKKHNEAVQTQTVRLLKPSKLPASAAGTVEELSLEINDDIEIIPEEIETYLDGREKNIFSVTKEDTALLKSMFDVFKIPYIQADDEAEATCNALVKEGLADVTFSLDSDCIAYQVPLIIKDLNISTGICKVINFSKICDELELTPDEVTMFCIICRCDYNRHTVTLKGVGPVEALKLVRKYKTWDALITGDPRFQKHGDEYHYEKCVELFSLAYPDIKHVPVWDLRIDLDDIEAFMRANNLACDRAKIRSLWAPPKIIFADEEEA